MKRLATILAMTMGLTLATLVGDLTSTHNSPAAAAVPCVQPANNGNGPDPSVFRGRDTAPLTKHDLDRLVGTTGSRVMARTEARLASRIYIAVHVKVVSGTHRGERGIASTPAIKRMVKQLNNGFHSAQAPQSSANTRYYFVLRRIKRITRDGWYHASLFGPRDRRAKRVLHTGNRRTLNLYINGGTTHGQPVLGWARFPWQVSSRLQSVTVHHESMYGGASTNYNRGDTIIHEVGHWMGLFHTFQDGCDPDNDRVADTPAMAAPSYGCPKRANTCPAAGRDPVTNFMDYSFDLCMNKFSLGQVGRMDAAWATWRL